MVDYPNRIVNAFFLLLSILKITISSFLILANFNKIEVFYAFSSSVLPRVNQTFWNFEKFPILLKQ